jgi:hypothetical protein
VLGVLHTFKSLMRIQCIALAKRIILSFVDMVLVTGYMECAPDCMESPQYRELRSLIVDSSAAFIVPTFSCAFLIKASFVLLDFSDL